MRTDDDYAFHRACQRTDQVGRVQVFDGLLGKLTSVAAGILKKAAHGRFALVILSDVGATTLFDYFLRDSGKMNGLSGGSD
jgi:hypothetical protein